MLKNSNSIHIMILLYYKKLLKTLQIWQNKLLDTNGCYGSRSVTKVTNCQLIFVLFYNDNLYEDYEYD